MVAEYQWGNGVKTMPKISSPYGPRKGGNSDFHHGCDFIGYEGIYPITSGVVTLAGPYTKDAGNCVAIDYPYKGVNGETITIIHMHMDKIFVRVGQTVNLKTLLGTMGDTGNASGKCDHVEIRYWLKGKYRTVDPVEWITWKMEVDSANFDMRKVGQPVNARTRPNTDARISERNSLEAGVIGKFKGYVTGEKVEGNNIWFVGYYSGCYYWSGAFTDSSTRGLRNLN